MATMEGGDATESPGPQVVFRPSKKKKVYRQRQAEAEEPEVAKEPDNEPETLATMIERESAAAKEADGTRTGEKALSIAEALRLRNARKAKIGGVGFGVDGPTKDSSANTEQSLQLHESREDAAQSADALVAGITRRFAPQTGLVGEIVNKHMEEYIESELSRRKQQLAEQGDDQPSAASTSNDAPNALSTFYAGTKDDQPKPTMRGKLQEIDLGDEVRARNIAMTERARKRLEGDDEDEDESGKPRKVRLGRDGKPLRSRNRRTSDDIKRDQIVEEFLRENRLDVYDVPQQRAVSSAPEDDAEAADDRLAEEFRREFYDAMSERRQRRRPAQPAKNAKNQEEILRGPKLGGSRNARAAMRDLLLKEQEKKK